MPSALSGIPSEEFYFCLECKRLNVPRNGGVRAYTAEYVVRGMVRFVTGQYSRSVRHGGMLGYVFDGDLQGAMANIEANINIRLAELGMTAPGELQQSNVRPNDPYARETSHGRSHETGLFRLHHLFLSGRTTPGAPGPDPAPAPAVKGEESGRLQAPAIGA